MERLVPLVKAVVLMAVLHIHLRHQFHGPTIDYLGLALAAFGSFAAVPGPGEPVLIAESIFAAKHNLGITEVIVVAAAGATAGGMAGWLAGLKAGRALVTAPGPFRRARAHAVEHGEMVFERHPVLAIYLTPSWVAGIHRVHTWIFLVTNLVSAILWAASIGLGAYFLGPVIVDLLSDMGLVTGVALGVLIVGSVIAEVVRRRRHRAHRPGDEDPGDQDPVTAPSPPRTR
jgi:membrane protein DedA with SNARE-associated domain